MSDFARGDIVSLSRSQVSLVDVLSVPAAPDEPYSITLPINPGDDRTFTYLGQLGDTVNDVLAGLAQALDQGQSPFAVDVVGLQLVIVGALGLTYATSVTSNLQATVDTQAVRAEDADGDLIGPLKVLEAESRWGHTREFATRRVPSGDVVTLNVLTLRELGSGRTFEVEAGSVLTVIEREGTEPFESPGP